MNNECKEIPPLAERAVSDIKLSTEKLLKLCVALEE